MGGDLRQDPGGHLRHQQRGQRDQTWTPAQSCWRGSCWSRGSVREFRGLLLDFCKSTSMTTQAEIGRAQSCFLAWLIMAGVECLYVNILNRAEETSSVPLPLIQILI